MSDILKAILKINPNAKVSVNSEDLDQIQWHDGTTPISKADIEAQFTAVDFDTAMKNLRAKRNKLLADSDWEVIMAKEKGTTLSTAFKTYRQDLRDLTNGLTTKDEVDAVTFPTKP
ncbi:putative tail fiber assembly protein [uncultured Mediterranean phage uvMED]|nr:putative tail fiber assembly protein [uncultured Mediterranean phage uvMED]BAQ90906.1 putative tail fiber assembly protein [uncultured Mediterranean phage uvMED]